MKVLFINPPYFDVYKGFRSAARLGACYPPTGLLYIASAVQAAGHQVGLIDVDVEGLALDGVMERVRAFAPDVVGLTATTPTFANAKKLIKEIKKQPGILTILGGIHLTIMMGKVLEEIPELDVGVYGEGEKTFVELLKCLENREVISPVAGILFRDVTGAVKINPPRDLIRDLDVLPFPARGLLKPGAYRWSVPRRGVQDIAVVITKRGCPFGCRFCSAHSMFGHRVRYRSVGNVIAELEDIVRGRKISHLIIGDDTLVLDRKWMADFCRAVKDHRLTFTWEGMARANNIDEDILRLMSGSGLVRISFGIESGDQAILDRENKGITLQQLRDAYRWAKACGIETRGSVIIGHPSETQATVWRTIRFLRSLKDLDQVYINIMVPYPGTEVYEIARQGKDGMKLLCEDFEEFVRYDHSVIEVNDLTKNKLVFFQKVGLLYFYLTPRRIVYNIRRAGLRVGIENARAFVRGIWGRGKT